MIDRVLEKLYEAPLNLRAWGETVEAVASLVDAAGGGQFHIFDVERRRTVYSCMPSFVPREAELEYNTQYKAIDPRQALTANSEPGAWYFEEDYFDERVMNRSDVFQFLWRNNIRHGARVRLHPRLDLNVIFGLCRAPGQKPFGADGRVALRPLSPHLVRAANMTMQLDELRRQALAGIAGLDALADSVVIVDARGRIAFQNQAAQRLFMEARAVVDRGGWLHCVNAACSGALSKAVKAAAERSIGSALMLRDAMGQPHVSCRVLALPQSGVLAERGAARQVLIVMRHGRVSEQQVRAAAAPYGLTPAEARVAQGLLTGLNAKALAGQLGVSIDTVRTQIRQILTKTNTRRQPEALSLLSAAGLVRTS